MNAKNVTLPGEPHATVYYRGGSGETVLWLHHLAGMQGWEPVHEALSKSFDVVAPYQPGFGESEGEALDDFDNGLEICAAGMGGKAKVRFSYPDVSGTAKPTDHGVLVFDTAAKLRDHLAALGVELPLEDVPIVQKLIVEKARRNAKPVIVATQMLESMISAPRPTRAEASDVANAVLDGADAVMLSGETSVGEYPIHTVNTMARIVESTEIHGLPRMAAFVWKPRTKSGVICRAASEVAEAVDARFLVAFTTTGDSARRMTRYRSRVPVIAFTPEPKVRNQLAMSWGIETFLVPEVKHTDDMVLQVDKALLEIGRCGEGQQVVIVAGSPPGIPGSTNALRIHNMGDAINRVAPAYGDPQG